MIAPKTFKLFLEEQEDLRRLYASLLDPKDIELHKRLSRMVQDAYTRGDQATAERLDAQLEELEEKMDSRLGEMDDGDMEEDRGEEEKDIDRDWSVQEDMARIYARYLAGDFYDTEETVEVDPEEAKKKGWEYKQGMDLNAKPVNRFYRRVPVTKQQILAKILRGAIWDSPFAHQYGAKTDMINAMTDEQIIDAARDAYEWKRGLLSRIRGRRNA